MDGRRARRRLPLPPAAGGGVAQSGRAAARVRAPGPGARLHQVRLLDPADRSPSGGAIGVPSHRNRRPDRLRPTARRTSPSSTSSPLDTNTRKLQLTQTFSLAALAPVDLQRFRETGRPAVRDPAVSSFGTPGMYLATIRAVRLSIAALIPPTSGDPRNARPAAVPATSSSRTATAFQTVTLARPPETIVLTSPASASGVFQVDLTPELLAAVRGLRAWISRSSSSSPRRSTRSTTGRSPTCRSRSTTPRSTARTTPPRSSASYPTRTSNSLALSLRDFPDGWYQLVAQAQTALAGQPATGDSSARVLSASGSSIR